MKIALFDIWLSNEDRNRGNYNLLLQAIEGGFLWLYVIDHSDIFNSSMAYNNRLVEITEEESLLTSELALLLFQKDISFAEKQTLLLEDFHRYIVLCNDCLPSILAQVPKNWRIDTPYYETKIRTIFSPQWIETCKNTFKEYTRHLIHFL